MDRRDIEPLADEVDRLDLRADVVVPHDVLHVRIGRFPANDEHREALFDGPLDEALLRREVEDVKPVDPRREDHQRGLEHGIGRGRILDELVERPFVEHLAGRGGDVLAQPEGVGIGVGELAALEVGDQVTHSFDEVLALRLDLHDA